MKSVLKYGVVGLLAAAIIGMPTQLLAQTTNKTAATKKATVEKKATADKKRTGGGVHGNLAAIETLSRVGGFARRRRRCCPSRQAPIAKIAQPRD